MINQKVARTHEGIEERGGEKVETRSNGMNNDDVVVASEFDCDCYSPRR